jgi:hypothetical protein
MNATKLFSIRIILGLVPLFLLYSCNKEDAPTEYSPMYQGYKVSFPDTLISAESYNCPEFYAFDVDNDGVNDYEITCNQEHLVCVYTYYEAKISCLNKDAFIATEALSDTTFVNIKRDTIFYEDQKEIIVKKTFSPKRLNTKDSIATIKQLQYVISFGENTKIDYRTCTNGTYLLNKENYSVYYSDYITGPGWNLHVDVYYLFPQLFPQDKASYIGIKKIVNGEVKTGWIKLLPIEYRRICILEVALQNENY